MLRNWIRSYKDNGYVIIEKKLRAVVQTRKEREQKKE